MVDKYLFYENKLLNSDFMSLENLKGKIIRLRKSRRFPDRFDPFDWIETEKNTLESIKIVHPNSGDFVVQKLTSIQTEDNSIDRLTDESIFTGASLEECIEYLKSQNIIINFVNCC